MKAKREVSLSSEKITIITSKTFFLKKETSTTQPIPRKKKERKGWLKEMKEGKENEHPCYAVMGMDGLCQLYRNSGRWCLAVSRQHVPVEPERWHWKQQKHSQL